MIISSHHAKHSDGRHIISFALPTKPQVRYHVSADGTIMSSHWRRNGEKWTMYQRTVKRGFRLHRFLRHYVRAVYGFTFDPGVL